jgi:uncharacterized protein YyaL (SSP411 family)
MTRDETAVEWREWGPSAFAEARRRDQPVLLALTATWCGDCHEMDARTYADPAVAEELASGFVPVRVDVDRHPRVRERYNAGGFPSTAFCTPTGELIAGAGFLGPDGLRQVMTRVGERWAESGTDAGRIPRAVAGDPTPSGPVGDHIESRFVDLVATAFDEEFGGWGDGPKFPLPRTVEFALKRDRERARRALDAVDGALVDADGGFFRYARSRDWSDPDRAKLLADNAALVRAFANAYCYTGDDAYRETAARGVDYLVDALWNGSAFGGSQAPAEGDDRPRTDLTAFAGPNALAVDALLTLVAYTDADGPRAYARRTLSTLRSSLVAADGTVRRWDDPDAPTLVLSDHARTVAAATRAVQVLDADGALDLAERVADRAIDALFDDGSFRDGPATGPGLLDRPLRPIDGNVEMAEALLDLSALTGDERYRSVARDAVGAFAGAWERLDVRLAGYGTVAARLTRPTPLVEVGSAAGSDLHRAALRIADHETVVRPAAPGVDVGVARVVVGDRTRTAATPSELESGVAALLGE